MKDTYEGHPDDDPPELMARANAQLYGHGEAEAALLRAWSSGRLPHAWLIQGPRGIGKATLAFRFARFALAGGGEGGLFGPPKTLALPKDSKLFRRVQSLGHADLRYVRRSLNRKTGRVRQEIGVDDVRDMGEFLRLTPAEGGWRIVIIDSADEMNRNAANAALKAIEEPPARALILLVCHQPGRLLPTIRSRCRRLVLRPLDEDSIVKVLALHRPDLAPEEARAGARLADGSASRALALAEEGGAGLRRALLDMLAAWPQIDLLALDGLGDRLARSGGEASFRVFGELLSGLLVRVCRQTKTPAGGAEANPSARLSIGPRGFAGGAEEDAIVARLAAGAGLDRWLEVWEKTGRLFARAEGARLDRKQVVLDAMLSVMAART